MQKYRDDESKVYGKGFTRWGSEQNGYQTGTRITTHGIVDIYTQYGDGWDKYTRIDFVWKGRMYMRNFDEPLSKKKIAQLSNEFAHEIVNRRPRKK